MGQWAGAQGRPKVANISKTPPLVTVPQRLAPTMRSQCLTKKAKSRSPKQTLLKLVPRALDFCVLALAAIF